MAPVVTIPLVDPSMEGSKVDKPDDDKEMGPFTIGNHRYMALSPSKVIAIQLYLPERLNPL